MPNQKNNSCKIINLGEVIIIVFLALISFVWYNHTQKCDEIISDIREDVDTIADILYIDINNN